MAHERRMKSRYPLELNVRYQILGAGGAATGSGQTINISSSGMLLACASSIAEGTRLKAFVEWPSLLNGTTPLQLIMVGTVVRRTPIGVSMVFESYQFRTMGRARYANVKQMAEPVAQTYGDSLAEPVSLIAKSWS
jgi:hypothetical protein